MSQRVIVHSSVSLDNAIVGFEIDIGLHYTILQSFAPDAVLVGSTTARVGIETFSDINQPEHANDRIRPQVNPADPRPIGVFVDSRGRLMNLLHFYRQMEHIKDVIVLVSDTTPEEYLLYLKERDYPFIRCGKERVNLIAALSELEERFFVRCIVSDSGSELNDHLINRGIADEMSLIVSPVIVGSQGKKLFSSVNPATFDLIGSHDVGGGRVHLRYALKKR